MIYFDNAATGGRKPDPVLNILPSTIKTCANPGRSGHKLSLSCAERVQACRKALNDFFDGYGVAQVAFSKNCTEALNVALFGILEPGDHVVTTCMEHNSVLRPLEHLRNRGIIEYNVCPLTGDPKNGQANINADSIRALLRPNTKLVAITAASNVTGTAPPIAEIREALPQSVLLLCDGAQGCGHLDIKMQRDGIDLLAVAGHKGMQGIQGSGALLFSERAQPKPLHYGGTGSMSLSLDMPDFYPDCLEAGTLSYPAIVSLLEGTRYLAFRMKQIQSRLLMLTAYFIRGLQSMEDYTSYSTPNPCGIVAFRHSDYQSEHLAALLSSKYDIAVRGGLHCAPLMHSALGTADDGLIRVSFSHFNSEREIDKLLAALDEIGGV